MTKNNILVFHDRNDWPKTFVENLVEIHGFKASLVQKPSECLNRVRRGLSNVDVIILHKDLGQHVPEEWGSGITPDLIARSIHEEAEHVRLIVVSGEYPDGTKHVLEMKADGYCNALDVGENWMIQQLNKGSVTRQEIESRGRRIEMPPTNTHLEKW